MCGDRSACVFCSNFPFFSSDVSHIWMTRTQHDGVALRTELLLTQGWTFLLLFYFFQGWHCKKLAWSKVMSLVHCIPSRFFEKALSIPHGGAHTHKNIVLRCQHWNFSKTSVDRESFCPPPLFHPSPFLKPPEKWCSESLHGKRGRSCRQCFHLLWCAQ